MDASIYDIYRKIFLINPFINGDGIFVYVNSRTVLPYINSIAIQYILHEDPKMGYSIKHNYIHNIEQLKEVYNNSFYTVDIYMGNLKL